MRRYAACQRCATAIANADLSAVEGDDLVSVEAAIESVGLVVQAGEHDPPGYWECFFCNDVQIGKGHVFEGEDRP